MTDKLAEQLLLTSEEKEAWKPDPRNDEKFNSGYLIGFDNGCEAQQAKDLNTPITIEGGVCPDCYRGRFRWKDCATCKGTGKLPDKTITVREAIERAVK